MPAAQKLERNFTPEDVARQFLPNVSAADVRLLIRRGDLPALVAPPVRGKGRSPRYLISESALRQYLGKARPAGPAVGPSSEPEGSTIATTRQRGGRRKRDSKVDW
jgi:hypothetical protein